MGPAQLTRLLSQVQHQIQVYRALEVPRPLDWGILLLGRLVGRQRPAEHALPPSYFNLFPTDASAQGRAAAGASSLLSIVSGNAIS